MSPRTIVESSASPDALDGIIGGLVVRCERSEPSAPSTDAWERALAIARAAAAREIRPVGVWTERAPSPAEVARAATFEVRELGLALHGARREVHDWHSHPGAFDEVLAALTAARAHGIAPVVASAVTRSNARVLVELPSLLKSAGVALWALSWPRTSAANKAARLGLAVPAALAAMERARRLGLPAWVLGAPVCVLGPFAARALPSPPRAYPAHCAGCPMRDACPGTDADYLTRFGGAELKPLDRRAELGDAPALAALVAGYAPTDAALQPR